VHARYSVPQDTEVPSIIPVVRLNAVEVGSKRSANVSAPRLFQAPSNASTGFLLRAPAAGLRNCVPGIANTPVESASALARHP
jgi:hypothetical protein